MKQVLNITAILWSVQMGVGLYGMIMLWWGPQAHQVKQRGLLMDCKNKLLDGVVTVNDFILKFNKMPGTGVRKDRLTKLTEAVENYLYQENAFVGITEYCARNKTNRYKVNLMIQSGILPHKTVVKRGRKITLVKKNY